MPNYVTATELSSAPNLNVNSTIKSEKKGKKAKAADNDKAFGNGKANLKSANLEVRKPKKRQILMDLSEKPQTSKQQAD